jgi:hypothetical protein
MRSSFCGPLRHLQKETGWLLLEFMQSAKKFPVDRHGQLACEMVVIRMHDAWARFCREIVITSAIGNTVTISGLPVSRCHVTVTDHGSAVAYLLSTYKKRRYEPKWGDVQECIDAASRFRVTNLSTLSAGLGATNSPAEEIRHARNYYAHRKGGSALKAMATNLFTGKYFPEVRDLNRFTSGGSTVIESWVQRLTSVATASIQ